MWIKRDQIRQQRKTNITDIRLSVLSCSNVLSICESFSCSLQSTLEFRQSVSYTEIHFYLVVIMYRYGPNLQSSTYTHSMSYLIICRKGSPLCLVNASIILAFIFVFIFWVRKLSRLFFGFQFFYQFQWESWLFQWEYISIIFFLFIFRDLSVLIKLTLFRVC